MLLVLIGNLGMGGSPFVPVLNPTRRARLVAAAGIYVAVAAAGIYGRGDVGTRVFEKDPGDLTDLEFDFSAASGGPLLTGEDVATIVDMTITPSGDPEDLVFTAAGVPSGQKIVRFVDKGRANVKYLINISITSDAAAPRSYNRDFFCLVKEL